MRTILRCVAGPFTSPLHPLSLHRSNLSEEVEYTRFLPLNGSFKEGPWLHI